MGLRHLLVILVLLAGCAAENHWPLMEPLADRQVRVGETLRVTVHAEDPDGDALRFYVDGKPPGASFSQDGTTALLVWSPSVTDTDVGGREWPVTVSVQDSHGAWISQTFTILALLQSGVPVFLTPPGAILNLAQADYLSFRVEVKDDDSAHVTLREIRGLAGAELRTDGPKSALFVWRPTADQIAQSSFHTAVFGADDDVHAEVHHEVALVLVNAMGRRSCPGQSPTLRHTPPPDQWGQSSIAVKLEAQDPESPVRFPTLFWAWGDEPATDAYTAVTMEPDPGDETSFVAQLPTPGVGEPARFLSYYFSATDNDDLASERCDHATRLPKEGSFYVAAYARDAQESDCLNDRWEPNDGADDAPRLDPGEYAPLRLCAGDEDWFTVELAAGVQGSVTVRPANDAAASFGLDVLDEAGGAVATSVATTEGRRADVPAQATDRTVWVRVHGAADGFRSYALALDLSEEGCPPDLREPDDGLGEATLVPAGGGSFTDGTVCPGNADWFAVDVAAGGHVRAVLTVDAFGGDLDLALVDVDGVTELARAERPDVLEEELGVNLAVGGRYYLRVYAAAGVAGSYGLGIVVTDQSEVCQDDFLSPNHARDTAFMLPEYIYEDLVLCPGAPDWFALGLNGGERLTVMAEGDAEAGLHVAVLGPSSSAPLGEGAGDDSGLASVELDVPTAGDYRFEVTASAEVATSYTLYFFAEDPPGPCLEDRLAGNHDAAHAALVTDLFMTHLKLCGGQEDWFRFEAPPNATVYVDVYYADGWGNLALDLLRADDESLVASSRESEYPWSLTATVDTRGGPHLIRVSGPGVDGLTYDISVFSEL